MSLHIWLILKPISSTYHHFPGGANDKRIHLPIQEMLKICRFVPSLGWEDPLEEEMATHSSILAWETPWTEESGGLQSMGSQRVGHD